MGSSSLECVRTKVYIRKKGEKGQKEGYLTANWGKHLATKEKKQMSSSI